MKQIKISINKINGKDAKRFKNEQNTDVETFFYDETFEDYQDPIISENGVMQIELEVDVEYDAEQEIEETETELRKNLVQWFEKTESKSKIYDALRDFAIANNCVIQTAVQIQPNENERE